MDEAGYWTSLRFRINCLPTDHPAGRVARPGWCDWFEPRRYVLDGPSPRITGRVGFVSGRHAWERHFILLVGSPFESSAVEWDKLLPPEDSESWLWWEDAGQVIVVDPRGTSGSLAEPGAAADGGHDSGPR
jgi:hypothetical protein